ncbi:MAG: HD-GYP domain-containing protein [Leptospiraceae bacterium]|nr:HD-GYP domain-containing protein [Leptospiraceae bacterium]MCK6379828.1 HD-GYP domain-containing protein [Leptospiraceae bacterium]NUM40980.1 HD-GYP domain-containing protein [Leptospiraceae bacterium]
MKVIKVSEIKPGQFFTKPVYLDKDIVFVNANVPISENDLERLKKFGITEVSTAGEVGESKAPIVSSPELAILNKGTEKTEEINTLKILYEQIVKSKTHFHTLYRESFETIQYIYRQIAEDKIIEINSIREVSEKLVDYIRANPHVAFNILTVSTSGYFLYNQVLQSSLFSILIGTYLEYSKPKLVELGISSLFADIGMAKIPSYISEKNSSLSEDEVKTVRKHTVLGYQILTQQVKIKNNLALTALQHHENFDGSGYPQKLSGTNIEEFARIHTIADNFAARIHPRPYRGRILPYEAIKSMISIDMNKFDLKIVRIFLNKISMYPIGSSVELSDGRTAMVIDSNTAKPLRPSLKLMQDASGAFLKDMQFLNLLNDTNIYITKAIETPNL